MGSSPSWDKDHGKALEVSSALPRIGQRVVLRRLSTADLVHFQAYRQDEEVGRYQAWTSEPDHQALTFLEEMSSAPLFALEHTAILQVVGITDARNIPSVRLLERAGMRRVATVSSVFRGGAVC